ncbi:uncharacterized protein BJ212DRAFT_1289779, partial [Suillus subaureus]
TRESNYYMAQGRAIRHIISLFNNIEDLVAENNRRLEANSDEGSTLEYIFFALKWPNRLQIGYAALTSTLTWFHKKGMEMEYDEYLQMLKMLQHGADSAQGDNTSKLKGLVSKWVNQEFKPDPLVDPNDKHSRRFTNDACGRLLCPAELNWNDPMIPKTHYRSEACYVVTDLSFPTYLYDKYTANPEDLEEGLFKSKILLQGYKAVFISPSSAKDVKGDGDGMDVIQHNRHARKTVSMIKVKKHVQFALSSVTLWRSVDGDFNYIQFWQTIVDFFENAPGQEVQHRATRLLKWWTQKIFRRSHRNGLSDAAKENMSINTLARQRTQHNNVTFNSS